MNAAIAVILGGGTGFGVFVVARSVRRRPVPLTDVVTRLEQRGAAPAGAAGTEPGDDTMAAWQLALGRFGVRTIPSSGFGAARRQLRVLDTTIERHAYEKVLGAVVGFVLPVSMMLVGAATGEVSVSPLLVGAGSGAGAAAGFLYPDLVLSARVGKRREAFRHAFSSYLDLVAIILAGGGGIETALEGAADAGDGWAFAELRGALRRARLGRRSPWDLFDELGHQLGISELRELAASAALAGGQGAKVKESLMAKADAMRVAQSARLEAAAEARTEKMIVPVAVLLVGLVLFIGYGAVKAISAPGTGFPDAPTIEIDEGGR